MILGLGNDLCDIRRMAAALARHGDRLPQRLCTAEEWARLSRDHDPAAALARAFAAKEAAAKALGTGFRQGVSPARLETLRFPGGRPGLRLHGGAAGRLAALTPPGHTAHLWLTLSDEPPLAAAVVVLEALPTGTVSP